MRILTEEQKALRKQRKREIALANLNKARAKREAMKGYLEGQKEVERIKLLSMEEMNDKKANVKQAFLEAFEETGGKGGLIKWIKARDVHREKFYDKLLKLLEADKQALESGVKVNINFIGLHDQPVVIEGSIVEEDGGVVNMEAPLLPN